MKVSKFFYTFQANMRYVVYFYRSDQFAVFSHNERERVERCLTDEAFLNNNNNRDILATFADKQGLIPAGFNELREITAIRHEALLLTRRLELTVLPTLMCNFKCPYCFEEHKSRKTGDKLPQALAKLIYRQRDSFDDIFIHWFGGEPLLKPWAIESLNSFTIRFQNERNKRFYSIISTNGYLMNKSIQQMLTRQEVHTAAITIDGASDTHNQIRNIRGRESLNTILENTLSYLKLSQENRVILRFQIHQGDSSEEAAVCSYTDKFKGYENQVFFYFRYLFSNCLNDWGLDKNSEEEQEQKKQKQILFIKKLYDKILQAGFQLYLKKIEPLYCYYERPLSWVVTPDGSCFKCTVMTDKLYALGNLGDGQINIDPVKFNQYDIKQVFSDLPECQNCPNIPLCWGGCNYKRFDSQLKGDNRYQCKYHIKPLSEAYIPDVVFLEKLYFLKQKYANQRRIEMVC